MHALAKSCSNDATASLSTLAAIVARVLPHTDADAPVPLATDHVQWSLRFELDVVLPLSRTAADIGVGSVGSLLRTMDGATTALATVLRNWQPTLGWQVQCAFEWMVEKHGLQHLVDATIGLYHRLRTTDHDMQRAIATVQSTLVVLESWLASPPLIEHASSLTLVVHLVQALLAVATGDTTRWEPSLWRVSEPLLGAVLGETKSPKLARVHGLLQLYCAAVDRNIDATSETIPFYRADVVHANGIACLKYVDRWLM